MQAKELLWIIKSIDKQIGKCLGKDKFHTSATLLELRNDLMRQFKPDEGLNWTIQDKNALNVLNQMNWKETFES